MNARLLAAVVVLGVAGSAMGQYALDRSLQVGSAGRNGPGRDFKKELEFRNAIVTGNAPGGISFRGDVGYRAPGEFFGSLGSNETFAFRRDSAYSGLGGWGLRGTDALQYQFAVTTGNAPPRGLTGIPVFERAGASGEAYQNLGTPVRIDGLSGVKRAEAGQFGFDSRGLSLMSVRSPSAYMANRGLQPTLMGRGDEGAVPRAIMASMLRGIAYDDVGVLLQPKVQKDERKPPPTAVPSTALATGAPTTENKTVDGPEPLKTAYDELVARMQKNSPADAGAKGGAEKPGDKKAEDIPDWQRRINELRDLLSDKSRMPVKPTKPESATAPKPGPAGESGDKGPNKAGESKTPAADQDTLGLIKRSGERISALAPASFDPYGSQMKIAQEHLAAGRYFDAEERFTTALSARPGDPMAIVGRIHAQLGAGMFLSAAINLRGLLTDHPELASTRYSDALLPSGERRQQMMERLGELAAEADGRGRDPGLLLAYMGYQTGDRAAMKRGLGAMTAGGGAEPDQLSRLASVLSKVWAPGDAPVTEPAAPHDKPEPNK